jgi:hypothetical protein
MILWLIVMTVFLGKFVWQLISSKKNSSYYLSLKKFSAWKIVGLLFLFILVGVLNGLARHNNLNLILLDFNAWLYFLLIIGLIIIYFTNNELYKSMIIRS